MKQLIIIAMLFVAGCSTPSPSQPTRQQHEEPPVHLGGTVTAKKGVATLQGEIDYVNAAAIQRGIDLGIITHGVIFSDSPGGYAVAGMEIGYMLRDHGLNSGADGYCMSACINAYVGGVERVAQKSTVFGVHRRSLDGVDLGYARYDDDHAYLTYMGAPTSFVDYVYSAPSTGMNRFTAKQAASFGMVTKVVE